MSFEHVKMVRALSCLSAIQKLILFNLAGRSDDKGYSWPSIPTIMRDTSIGSKKTVWANLVILQDKGLVRIERTHGGHNQYFLTLESAFLQGTEVHPVQKCTRYRSAPGVGTEVHPVQKCTRYRSAPGVGTEMHLDQVQKCTPKTPLSLHEESILSSASEKPKSDDNPTCEQETSQVDENVCPKCPYEQLKDAYNAILPELPMAKAINGTRQKHAQARWRETWSRLYGKGEPCDLEALLQWWKSFFEEVRKSDWLMGKVKDWRADFNFLVSPKGYMGVWEGKYKNRKPA